MECESHDLPIWSAMSLKAYPSQVTNDRANLLLFLWLFVPWYVVFLYLCLNCDGYVAKQVFSRAQW